MHHFYEVYEKAATGSIKLHFSIHPLSFQLSAKIPTSELRTLAHTDEKP
jgi:hypothetical protein